MTITSQSFINQGERLHYRTAGDSQNPPLVMVHGWTSYSGYWWPIFEALADTHYCIAIDLLGHGSSDKPRDGNYSITTNTRRVLALADHLGLDTFTFIGHSMGGQIGYNIALLHPERLERLITISGVASGRLSRYIRWVHLPVFYVGAMLPSIYEFSRLAVRRNWRWYMNIFDPPIVYDPSAYPVASMDHQMALVPGGEMAFYRELVEIPRHDLSDRLHEITTPTLVIFGRQDGTVPLMDAYLAGGCIPNAELVLIDRCGHSPLTEQPTQVVEAVRRFLYR
ncbi:MAG: alpha/beta hydrolase [bacterium]|nr:alpha/beta hydrolase [bacterium]